MTPRQRELARHALGLDGRRRRSYRNHYVCDIGTDEHTEWMQLLEAGLARRRACVEAFGGMDKFSLTVAGAHQALEPRESLGPEDFPPASIGIEER